MTDPLHTYVCKTLSSIFLRIPSGDFEERSPSVPEVADEAEFDGFHGGLGAVGDLQLAEEAFEVAFDGGE